MLFQFCKKKKKRQYKCLFYTFEWDNKTFLKKHGRMVGIADDQSLIWPLGGEDERLEERNDCQMYLHRFILLHHSFTRHSQRMQCFL